MTELRGMNRKNSFNLILNCNSVFLIKEFYLCPILLKAEI